MSNEGGDESSRAAKNDAVAAPPPDPSETVPQLDGVTFGELQTCIKVLNAVKSLTPPKKRKRDNDDSENLLERYKHSNLRPLRKALSQCLDLHQRTMYGGKTEREFYKDQIEERTLKRQKHAERARQKNYIATTALRRGRVERLNQKAEEAKDEEMAKLQRMMMIPDGHVETVNHDDSEGDDATTIGRKTKLLTNHMDASNGTDETALTATKPTPQQPDGEPVQLPVLRSCYVCKTRFRQLHHFYDQLCPSCAALNWEKRHQSCDLASKVAVVTGSRVKIGFQTCLKLLRAGATVVATTRFPNSAAECYRQQPDFDKWKDRLHVYGLDLRDVTGIEAFCRFLKMRYSECGLDILINNACQTVRRPTAYYLPNCQKEQELWTKGDETHRKMLGGCMEFERVRRKLLLDHKQQSQEGAAAAATNRLEASSAIPMLANSGNSETEGEKAAVTTITTTSAGSGDEDAPKVPFESTGMSHSAAMSQMVLLPEDVGISDSVLPPGVTDINGQQLDLRKTNSWLLRMEEVSTPEVMECMFINAIAPFVLNSRLKPLMCVPNPHPDRYVINVSAMEGKFYRYKMANHPHTNMAKAALNMMTRTSAEDLATTHGIYMNSVDTGWINDENPLEKASQTAKANLFQTPIDEIDAAARILDPVFSGVSKKPEEPKEYGKFLKDYHETEW